jgi:hypothetical protein
LNAAAFDAAAVENAAQTFDYNRVIVGDQDP